MIADLQDALDALAEHLEGVDYGELSRTDLLERVGAIQSIADSRYVEEVRCKRCDRRFRTIPGVDYCTKECELGQTKLPYQTRDQQADFLLKAQRGQA